MKRILAIILSVVMLLGVGIMNISAFIGDVNADNFITINDVITLARYISLWNVSIDVSNSDVNSDGIVNIKDAVMLAQIVASTTGSGTGGSGNGNSSGSGNSGNTGNSGNSGSGLQFGSGAGIGDVNTEVGDNIFG
ncbi:MAG: dockerin type I domain-containing protein [Clostridia bacterium]|nr:dockerin type I domain-containing protein [Clostridia bacterium]